MGTYDRTKVDDAAFTPATDEVYPMGAIADESGTDSVDEGDIGAPRMTLDRKLLTRVVGATDSQRLDVNSSGEALVKDTAAEASLSVIDDWDESDRAKVNPIVGQAGVAAGAGTVSTTTQRVTVATDDVVSVDDNGASLTIDNATLSVTGGGVESGALRVTVANDSTGVLSVDDNGTTLSIDDGGGSITVDGTATITGTVTIEDGGNVISVDDAGASLTVDNPTLSVVGGGTEATALRVTVANDSTGVLSVDDNGGNLSIDDGGNSITVDNGGTFAVQDSAAEASLSVIDDWDESDRAKVNPIVGSAGIAGGAGTVSAATTRIAIATDANAVKLTDGTDTADVLDLSNSNPLTVAVVDGSGDQITSFGGGTQYTEDAAAAANPVGTALNLVRADSLAGLTTTDGDNVAARGTDKGEQYVKHVDAIAVTQSGTWDEVGINDSGNSITVDNAALSVVGSGTEATAQRVTIATDSTGVLSVDDNGGNLSIDDGGNSITVDGAVTVSGTVDTELTTADLDTGAGTDTRAVVGLVGSKSGGGQLIPGDATAGLKVDLGADNDVTVTGSVTANAGTNLNTSALALEAGGNLAAAAASLSVIDDWDESDRAKVNPIAGQAGVQGGAGAVTALTQRVAIATDANSVKLTDGTDVATVRDVTGAKSLDVSIVDGSGNQITSFGGGTQYTEGDTDASITGTAVMWEDASNTLRAVSTTKRLPVDMIYAPGETFSHNFASAGDGTTWSLASGAEAVSFAFVVTATGGATDWAISLQFSCDGGTNWITNTYDAFSAPEATVISATSEIPATHFRFVLVFTDAGGLDCDLYASPTPKSPPVYSNNQNASASAGNTSLPQGVLVMGLDQDSTIKPLPLRAGLIQVSIDSQLTGLDLRVLNDSSTFTSALTGSATSLSGCQKYFSLQVVATGAVTSWTVVLELSIDGTNYTTVLTHTNADVAAVKFLTTPAPALYMRARCVAIVLGAGTNVVAKFIGMQ